MKAKSKDKRSLEDRMHEARTLLLERFERAIAYLDAVWGLEPEGSPSRVIYEETRRTKLPDVYTMKDDELTDVVEQTERLAQTTDTVLRYQRELRTLAAEEDEQKRASES